MTPGFAWSRLESLSAPEWHALIKARESVFVVEQACAYQEADDMDVAAWHLRMYVHGELAACARVVDPGVKYAEPSIGRVMTLPAFRALKLGRALMLEAIRFTTLAFPGQCIRIGAQAHLQAFYASLGFRVEGDVYDEDGIPHIDMLRPADTATATTPAIPIDAHEAKIEAFFARYEQGANTFDPELMCSLYTAEFMAADPDGVSCGHNDAALRAAFMQRKAFFHDIGFRLANVLHVQSTRLDDRYTLAKVLWHMRFEPSPGQARDFRFHVSYVLHDGGNGPKAAFWISHEDERRVMREAGLIQ